MLKSILTRSALVALAMAGALAMTAPAAEARHNIRIWIGLPGFVYWNGPGYYHGRYRHYLSCGEGRRIVDHSGFNAVRATDCSPRYYHYKARRSGHWYIVRLDSRSGHINAHRM